MHGTGQAVRICETMRRENADNQMTPAYRLSGLRTRHARSQTLAPAAPPRRIHAPQVLDACADHPLFSNHVEPLESLIDECSRLKEESRGATSFRQLCRQLGSTGAPACTACMQNQRPGTAFWRQTSHRRHSHIVLPFATVYVLFLLRMTIGCASSHLVNVCPSIWPCCTNTPHQL